MNADPRSRRRLVLALALGLVIVVTTGWLWYDGHEDPQTPEAVEVGNAADRPGEPACGPVQREPVDGTGDHVDEGAITYTSAPPSFGDHRSRWAVGALSFYDIEDRPDVAVLVHNLEHGYNILWYDQAVIDDPDALDHVQAIASDYARLSGAPDPATAFIAAPWTDEDGAPFPDGMHFALTHWYADPTDRTASRADEVGLTRYCSTISAELVREWMNAYPLSDAPEGYPDLM